MVNVNIRLCPVRLSLADIAKELELLHARHWIFTLAATGRQAVSLMNGRCALPEAYHLGDKPLALPSG